MNRLPEYYASGTSDPEGADPIPEPRPLIIMPRKYWSGSPYMPEGLKNLPHPLTDVVFSYTETERCETAEECKIEMKKLYDDARAKGLPDIPYNFVVAGDGTVFEGRGWHFHPEPNPAYPGTHGLCVEIAHFGERGDPPPPNQLEGSWELVLEAIRNKTFVMIPRRHSVFY